MNPSTENSRTECSGAGRSGGGSSSQQSANSPRLCSRGCGFYGAAENRGMCSKCFKDSNADPRLCIGGCGFYGAAENKGMCSKCFKDSQNDKIPKFEAAVIGVEEDVSDESKIKIRTELETSRIGDSPNYAWSSTDQSVPETSPIGDSSINPSISNDQSLPETSRSFNFSNNGSISAIQAVPAVRNRCVSCNKKVGMLGFGCRCGGTFCGKHRYPEEHSCNFDFKKAGKIMIERENPLGRPDKIKDRI